jgi:hypothetical protein
VKIGGSQLGISLGKNISETNPISKTDQAWWFEPVTPATQEIGSRRCGSDGKATSPTSSG